MAGKENLSHAFIKVAVSALIYGLIEWVFSQNSLQIFAGASVIVVLISGHTIFTNYSVSKSGFSQISISGKLIIFSFLIMALPLIAIGAVEVIMGGRIQGGITLFISGMFTLTVASYFGVGLATHSRESVPTPPDEPDPEVTGGEDS